MVRLDDIDFQHRQIRTWNCKRKIWQYLRMHDLGFDALKNYVKLYGETVRAHENFLVFDPYSNPGDSRHCSSNYLRNVFRRYLRLAGLNDTYAEVDTTGAQHGRKEDGKRRLHRLSTHSLRHYFISKVYESTKDPLITQKCARHKRFSSTECYIQMSDDQIQKGMDATFNGGSARPKVKSEEDGDFEEFMRFYKMWKAMKGR